MIQLKITFGALRRLETLYGIKLIGESVDPELFASFDVMAKIVHCAQQDRSKTLQQVIDELDEMPFPVVAQSITDAINALNPSGA